MGSIPTASTISKTALRGLDQLQDLQGGFGLVITFPHTGAAGKVSTVETVGRHKMIPRDIDRQHIMAAMQRIDRDGVQLGRDSRGYEVRHNGRVYPPKLLISLAGEIAYGRAFPSSGFSGGVETNRVLQRLGFTVAVKGGKVLPPLAGGTRPSIRRKSSGADERPFGELAHRLLYEAQPFTWEALSANRGLPPATPGVYAWFFRTVPKRVPTKECVQQDDRTLIYVGISPGRDDSGETLRSRIRYHYRGNAEGSTLRLTLGCLLEEELGTRLRRVGSGTRMTFAARETALTAWMATNAAVAWVETIQPRALEEHLLRSRCLPLNLEANARSPFYDELKQIRAEARRRARQLPVLKK